MGITHFLIKPLQIPHRNKCLFSRFISTYNPIVIQSGLISPRTNRNGQLMICVMMSCNEGLPPWRIVNWEIQSAYEQMHVTIVVIQFCSSAANITLQFAVRLWLNLQIKVCIHSVWSEGHNFYSYVSFYMIYFVLSLRKGVLLCHQMLLEGTGLEKPNLLFFAYKYCFH